MRHKTSRLSACRILDVVLSVFTRSMRQVDSTKPQCTCRPQQCSPRLLTKGSGGDWWWGAGPSLPVAPAGGCTKVEWRCCGDVRRKAIRTCSGDGYIHASCFMNDLSSSVLERAFAFLGFGLVLVTVSGRKCVDFKREELSSTSRTCSDSLSWISVHLAGFTLRTIGAYHESCRQR